MLCHKELDFFFFSIVKTRLQGKKYKIYTVFSLAQITALHKKNQTWIKETL